MLLSGATGKKCSLYHQETPRLNRGDVTAVRAAVFPQIRIRGKEKTNPLPDVLDFSAHHGALGVLIPHPVLPAPVDDAAVRTLQHIPAETVLKDVLYIWSR